MIGAKQMLAGSWRKPGVWNMEQHDPDAFMADLNGPRPALAVSSNSAAEQAAALQVV